MSVHMVIELRDREGVQTVMQALEAYKARLRAGIARTQRHLAEFEAHYGVDTAHFLRDMTAEDLAGGDLEYVEWAGEARLLEGLEADRTSRSCLYATLGRSTRYYGPSASGACGGRAYRYK